MIVPNRVNGHVHVRTKTKAVEMVEVWACLGQEEGKLGLDRMRSGSKQVIVGTGMRRDGMVGCVICQGWNCHSRRIDLA